MTIATATQEEKIDAVVTAIKAGKLTRQQVADEHNTKIREAKRLANVVEAGTEGNYRLTRWTLQNYSDTAAKLRAECAILRAAVEATK